MIQNNIKFCRFNILKYILYDFLSIYLVLISNNNKRKTKKKNLEINL